MTKRPPVDVDDDEDDDTPTTTALPMSASEPTSTGPTALTFTVDPASGPEHTPLVISGANFGETAGTIALNEVPAPVVTWTPIAVATIVPYGAKTGDLVVTTTDGRRGSASFTVTEP